MTLAGFGHELRGDVVHAWVSGDIDMVNADALRAALERAVPNEASGVVLDFSRIEYLDSTGVEMIFSLMRRLEHRGQRLRLVVPDGSPVEDTLRYADVLGAVERLRVPAEAPGGPGDPAAPR